jgi:hypothetical protein
MFKVSGFHRMKIKKDDYIACPTANETANHLLTCNAQQIVSLSCCFASFYLNAISRQSKIKLATALGQR